MSAENVQVATTLMEGLPLDDLAGAFDDPDRVAAMAEVFERVVDPDLEVAAVGPEYMGAPTTYRGMDGFAAFWSDWMEPWETFRIEPERYLDAGDKVVQLARQVGRTGAGAPEIEELGAAVMTFRGARIVRIEFHLDRDRAMRAAGLSTE